MNLLLVLVIVNIFVLGNVQGRVFNTKAVTKLELQQQLALDVRIIGGKPAVIGQFPWQVFVNFTKDQRSLYCGGSLISDEWILTAAQCVKGATIFSIRLGTTYSSGENEINLQTITSSYAIYHEQYNPNNFNNDIGLIKLSRKANLNQYVKPIVLDSSTTPAEIDLTVTGFGAVQNGGSISLRLNHVVVQSITNQRCQEFYGSSVTNSMICTLGNTVEGTCQGDGGSPLIRYVNGSSRHVGIASFVSTGGCDIGYPAGYTRTEPFRSWIRSKTGV